MLLAHFYSCVQFETLVTLLPVKESRKYVGTALCLQITIPTDVSNKND